jgi:hypothetical protein
VLIAKLLFVWTELAADKQIPDLNDLMKALKDDNLAVLIEKVPALKEHIIKKRPRNWRVIEGKLEQSVMKILKDNNIVVEPIADSGKNIWAVYEEKKDCQRLPH